LSYGKYVLRDEVVAIQPTADGRAGQVVAQRCGSEGSRSPWWGSRSEEAIIDDLVTPADEAARLRQQRSILQQVVKTFYGIPPVIRRVLREENGVDLDAVATDVRRIVLKPAL
jgi:hypothetical protein